MIRVNFDQSEPSFSNIGLSEVPNRIHRDSGGLDKIYSNDNDSKLYTDNLDISKEILDLVRIKEKDEIEVTQEDSVNYANSFCDILINDDVFSNIRISPGVTLQDLYQS